MSDSRRKASSQRLTYHYLLETSLCGNVKTGITLILEVWILQKLGIRIHNAFYNRDIIE